MHGRAATATTIGRPLPPMTAPLVPLHSAVARVLRLCEPAEATPVPLDDARGRVLAAPLVVPAAVPASATALRQGYAVASADLTGASSYSPVRLARAPVLLAPGDLLPSWADAILPPDALDDAGAWTEIGQSVPPGHDVRRAGEDASAGAVLLEAGHRMGALHLATARAAGIGEAVIRPLRVGLSAKADEASAALISAMAQRCGGALLRAAAPDMHGQAEAECGPHILVIVTDDPRSVLSEADEIIAPALATRPGDRIALARMGGMLVVAVPPRLADAFAACVLVLMPCLDRIAGRAPRRSISGSLTRKVASAIGFADIVLVHAARGVIEPLAVGDVALQNLASADGWMVIPPESEGFAAGEMVGVHPLDEAFG